MAERSMYATGMEPNFQLFCPAFLLQLMRRLGGQIGSISYMSERGKILVADDDPQMQLAIKASLTRGGYDVIVAGDGQAALERIKADRFDAIISDQRMPRMSGQELLQEIRCGNSAIPFIMITAHGTITQAVEAMQLGAADFITKPFSAEDLERVVERVLSPEVKFFKKESSRKSRSRAIVTNDPVMVRILEVAEAVARSDATVLVQGESGTGKELIARLIHSCSPRAERPFVAINCAALPANLLESEMFGHEKGAFTGALARKIGKFELAHGGTLLLDEISEMDLALQAKLLRVLQEREIDRVGGREPVSVDVRIVATTNRNLADAVEKEKFRADLYYRLNVIPLTLPPLRDRKADIKILAEHFMRQYLGPQFPELTADVLCELQEHKWPGNIRELQNSVQRAAILARGAALSKEDLLLNKNDSPKALHLRIEKEIFPEGEFTIRSGVTVQEMERNLILETLRSNNNNRTKAAQLLGISIRTLRNKLHEYREQGVDVPE
jgi:two-component system response regulator FlrC